MKLKYISHRVLLVFLVFLLCSLGQLGYILYLLQQGAAVELPLLVATVSVLVIVLTSYFWIYKPYRRTELLMNRFWEGIDTSEMENPRLTLLTPSVQKAALRVNEMVHAPEIYELNKRQAQYLALQNQINPHFLYNTLESIRSEAIIAGLDSVSDMTESLATFFRYTISKVENLVSIEEELENCKTYFHIQQYRFGDRLALHVECDQEDYDLIRHYRIPKLTLQPILENSIIHGTELKLGTSHLTIRFAYTEKRVLITISDDGIGMDQETLAKINQKLNSSREFYHDDKNKGGIALANVNNRIHLLFGEEYGMHVYSTPNVGTDVEISIPAIVSDREVKHGGVLG